MIWLLILPVACVGFFVMALIREKLSPKLLWTLTLLAIPALMLWWADRYAYDHASGIPPNEWAGSLLEWFFFGEVVLGGVLVFLLREHRWSASSAVAAGLAATLFAWLGAAQQISGVWL